MRKLAPVNSRIGAIEIERRNIAAQQDATGSIAAMRSGRVRKRSKRKRAEIAGEARSDCSPTSPSSSASFNRPASEAAQLGQQIAQVSEQLGSGQGASLRLAIPPETAEGSRSQARRRQRRRQIRPPPARSEILLHPRLGRRRAARGCRACPRDRSRARWPRSAPGCRSARKRRSPPRITR